MEDRARRIGENEILYRTINENIESLNAAFGTLTETMAVVCECGDVTCAEQIELDVPTYERVRADPALFVTLPGHEIPDVESVVERTESFQMVRKDAGKPEQLATEHDPRR